MKHIVVKIVDLILLILLTFYLGNGLLVVILVQMVPNQGRLVASTLDVEVVTYLMMMLKLSIRFSLTGKINSIKMFIERMDQHLTKASDQREILIGTRLKRTVTFMLLTN